MKRALFLALLVGCAQAEEDVPQGTPALEPDNDFTPPPSCGDYEAGAYDTIASLHREGVAKTCSRNEGVCHNSREYPDLRTATALVDLVGAPCNAGTEQPVNVNDACEPPGDVLVVPSLGIEHEIATVTQAPANADTIDLAAVTVTLVEATASPTGQAATDAEIHRGDLVAPIGALGAVVTTASHTTLTIDLTLAEPEVKAFLDDRDRPWTDERVREADVNGNGTAGFAAGLTMPLVAPGDPMGSYLVHRLVDPSFGELMPRQCRTWDDRATRAVGCWIEGLAQDGSNALDPIDYDACTFEAGAAGACSAQTPAQDEVGFDAVQGIFDASCGGNACHVGETEPQGGLDLTRGLSYQSLVGAAATELAGAVRVVPGDPSASYLACKLGVADCQRSGALMPPDWPLGDCEKDAIIRWIEQGARLPADAQ
jgi:hypothetical protein